MANTKKKVVTEEETEGIISETEEVVEEVKSTAKSKKEVVSKPKRIFEATDPISCRSVTYGELLLPSSKNKDMLYSWADYGDVQEVEYQDLRALRSRRSQYINGPLFVIEDEDLLDEWPDLRNLYASVAAVDLDQLFSLPVNELARRLQSTPSVYRETVKNAASSRILSGELDSISKIKAIDEVLGTNLLFYIQ